MLLPTAHRDKGFGRPTQEPLPPFENQRASRGPSVDNDDSDEAGLDMHRAMKPME